MVYCDQFSSPLGRISLYSDGEALVRLAFSEAPPQEGRSCPVLEAGKLWLGDYFDGKPREVDFPLAPQGTDFQKLVWSLLLTIPFGSGRSYGSLAREAAGILGRTAMSAQAIGGAVGRNPIPIVIPCHRVLGAKGELTGFGCGLDKKIWLLDHEDIPWKTR